MMNGTDANSGIKHPGATLAAMLDLVDMSRKELSLRVGVSEKHIAAVIDGSRDVSLPFAKRLECVFGLPALEWLDMQVRYDEACFERKERAGVHPEEMDIPLRLLTVIPILRKYKLLDDPADDVDAILKLRRFMGVSDLRVIPEITGTAVSRLRHRGCEDDIDPYVLLAWQQMCERLTENALTAPVMDIQKLGDSLPAIKHLMLYKESELPFLLGKAFAACGIAFRLVPPFEGAPVRGFVRKFPNGRGMLCLTARKERQDVFWFALFREISRIVNGNANFVDFSFKNPAETYVDNFTDEVLIPAKAYRRLVENGDFSFDIVRRFAESQIVSTHIVLARLLRDGLIKETEEVKVLLPEYTWENV